MSEITRYAVIETALCIGGKLHEGEVLMVRADEHDRELAALREELAKTNERWLNCLEGAEKKCERQIMRNSRLVGQRNNMQLKRDEARQRLAAAEQRNAALEKAISTALDDSCEGPGAAEVTIQQIDYEALCALTKYIGSGASHDPS